MKDSKWVLVAIFLIAIGFTMVHPARATFITPREIRTERARPIFVFHSDEFWLNLHHFLYVLGRAANKERDASRAAVARASKDQDQGLAKLNESEQSIWREAVSSYAGGLSKKDMVFGDPLPGITKTLAQAGKEKLPAGTDPATAAILKRAAPIYRKVWWPKHLEANQAWQSAMQKLVQQHGPAVLAFITKAYQMTWPDSGYHVHISGYANWAGAYSTSGNLLVMSSLYEDIRGLYGLEIAFHEGMHQWDDAITVALEKEAKKLNKAVPQNLDHALIFFTAGEAIRHVDPSHVPYAEKAGVWQRGLGMHKTVILEVWKPYLDGHGTRDEAFAELIRRMTAQPGVANR